MNGPWWHDREKIRFAYAGRKIYRVGRKIPQPDGTFRVEFPFDSDIYAELWDTTTRFDKTNKLLVDESYIDSGVIFDGEAKEKVVIQFDLQGEVILPFGLVNTPPIYMERTAQERAAVRRFVE